MDNSVGIDSETLKELHSLDKQLSATRLTIASIESTVRSLSDALNRHMDDEVDSQKRLIDELQSIKNRVTVLWVAGSIVGGLLLTVASEFIIRRFFQ